MERRRTGCMIAAMHMLPMILRVSMVHKRDCSGVRCLIRSPSQAQSRE
jgi:hypothetical protein